MCFAPSPPLVSPGSPIGPAVLARSESLMWRWWWR
jgi:hypothetical protein